MVTFKDLARGMSKMKSPFEVDESIPDEETRDKALRSLRRQQRRMLDRREKEMIKRQLKADAMRRDRAVFARDNVFGGKNILAKVPEKKAKPIMTRKADLLR